MKIDTGSGELTINDVVIKDTDIVQFFSSLKGDDENATEDLRQDLLVRALKIGVAALQRAQTQVDIDVIRREFEQLHQQVRETFDAAFHQDTGRLSLELEGYLGEKGKMADLFESEYLRRWLKFQTPA